MSRFNRKINWKSILSFVLVGVLLVGAVAGLGSVFGKDTKTISSMAFSVGGINEQGNYVDSETSIYTKDMFECQGLSIEPDFEATGSFKVFYYSENKNFIAATETLNAVDGVYSKGNTFASAKYARIMITPDVPVDEDGEEVDDFKIRFYEATSYASDYSITVSKKQDFKLPNLFVVEEDKIGKLGNFSSDGCNFEEIDGEGCGYVVADVRGYTDLQFIYKGNSLSTDHSYMFFDEAMHLIYAKEQPVGVSVVDVSVPAGAVYLVVNYNVGTEFVIQ